MKVTLMIKIYIHLSKRSKGNPWVYSIPELMGNSKIPYLKNGIGINKFGIEVCYQKIISTKKFTI